MSSRDSSPLSSPSRSTSPVPAAPTRETETNDVEARKSSSSEPSAGELVAIEEVEDGKRSKSKDAEDDDGEDDAPSSERAGASTDETPSSSSVNATPASNALVQGDWQAVWSPQHNMYYFYNMRTNETTWTNPVASSQAAGASQTSTPYDAQAAAAAQGIDPALAYLDPSLAAGTSNPGAFTYTAKFNARTGAFAKADARDPEHVSEYERMRRMNSVFFDMDSWQQEIDQRHAEEEEEEAGKKRKKPTKKDLDTFKERKRQKKLAKTAWLRT